MNSTNADLATVELPVLCGLFLEANPSDVHDLEHQAKLADVPCDNRIRTESGANSTFTHLAKQVFDMPRFETVQKSRQPGANFDVLEPEDVLSIDCDGIVNIIFNMSSVTLELYKTVPSRQSALDSRKTLEVGSHEVPEMRQISARLTMPAPVFFGIVADFTTQVRQNRTAIEARSLSFMSSIHQSLDIIEKGPQA